MRLITPIFVIISAGVAAIPSAALARHPNIVVIAPDEPIVSQIGYGDLNLSIKTDEHRLYRRVETAVIGLCDEAVDGDRSTGAFQVVTEACLDRAWAGAIPQITAAVETARTFAAAGVSARAAGTITIRTSG